MFEKSKIILQNTNRSVCSQDKKEGKKKRRK